MHLMGNDMGNQNQNWFKDEQYEKLSLVIWLPIILAIFVATQVSCTPTPEVFPTPSSTLQPTALVSLTPHFILGDQRVREGIAHCLNRAELIHSVYPWLAETAPFEMISFLPTAHWAYPQGPAGLWAYSFDPEKGKSLFEQAGWILERDAIYRTNAAGREMLLVLTVSNLPFRETWLAVFEEQMKACGLRIEKRAVSGEWLYETGLRQRDFEAVVYPWYSQTNFEAVDFFGCEKIPSAENDWQGRNYAGWCNPRADQAMRLARASLGREAQKTAYRVAQEEYLRDLPSIPLFNRVDIYAAHPELRNFSPDTTEIFYTWNAAQWAIPGRDEIVIALRSEPVSFFPPEDDSYAARLLGMLVFGADYTNLAYDYQPVMLKQIPAIENGMVEVNRVTVNDGEKVVDLNGNLVEIQPGVSVLDADGNEVIYTGSATKMTQLTVTYQFVEGLTWSDGIAVSQDDYRLSYKVMCDPDISTEFWEKVCEKISSVDFLSDTSYVVTWLPGYQGRAKSDYAGWPYFLPPIGRLPSHQVVHGQRLSDMPLSNLKWLDELNRSPLGVGPYQITQWEHGKQIVFTANPHYYLGDPATPRIIARFLSPEKAIESLLRGEVDLLDMDTLSPARMDLLPSRSDSRIRLYFLPSTYYEMLAFSLRSK